MTKRVIVILAVSLGLVLIGGGVFWYQLWHSAPQRAAAASAAVVSPRVADCGVKPLVVKPAEITGTCGDGGVVATKIVWRYWGPSMASGTATVTVNDCAPSCAEGMFLDYPATVVLDRVEVREAGPEFSRMTLVYTDHDPNAENRPSEDAAVDQFDLAL